MNDTHASTDFDAIVIGSGFGGAVAACRLAQSGQRVLVLERGRRYTGGLFPRDPEDVGDWLWSAGHQGLYDIQPLSGMLTVRAAGVGGGSLVYANVQMRAGHDEFASGWPSGYDRPTLDPYYDLVAYMLDIQSISQLDGRYPAKSYLMAQAAADLGREGQFFHPNLAVNFGNPDVLTENKFGVPQRGCHRCGECYIGCNFQAKNTLDLNYLAVAENHAAGVIPCAEARVIEPAEQGYNVHWHDLADDDRPHTTSTVQVFVCAGAIGSTELLLRCRDEYATLPNLPDSLGSRYSGNGDFLALGFSVPGFRPSEGPTITTATVYTNGNPHVPVWFLTEDGGYPPEFSQLIALMDFDKWAELGRLPVELAGTLRTQSKLRDREALAAILLLMGRDRAEGRIRISKGTRDVRIDWALAPNLPLYTDEAAIAADFITTMGGRYEPSPQWRLLNQPVSVHNLGGCPMSDDHADGVVDEFGQVHGHPGLFVLDGAIIPTSLGVNPAHTIAAIAERCVEHSIRQQRGDEEWRAPEFTHTVPVREPLDQIHLGAPRPPKTPQMGVRFTERMTGDWISLERQHAPSRRLEFTITISTSQIYTFAVDPTHPALAQGTIHIDGVTRSEGSPIVSGFFGLMADGGAPDRRKMLYSLPFEGADGQPYLLEGYKEVWDHGQFDVWGAVTTLYATIHRGTETSSPTIGKGVLHISPLDVLRELSNFQVTGARSPLMYYTALGNFSQVFFGGLVDTFLLPKLGLDPISPHLPVGLDTLRRGLAAVRERPRAVFSTALARCTTDLVRLSRRPAAATDDAQGKAGVDAP